MSHDFQNGRGRRAPSPLDTGRLEALALRYVGRYATTRGKLREYLRRKIAGRGWTDDSEPPVEAIVARMAAFNYVDDQAFALARSGALSRRGYGERRVVQALRGAGIEEEDAAPARDAARAAALSAALAFARRRRVGPYAEGIADPDTRRRHLGAMLRAGHDLALARRVIDTPPGGEVESD